MYLCVNTLLVIILPAPLPSMLLRFMRVCYSILNMIMTWMVFHFLSILLWKEVDDYLCASKASFQKTSSKFKPKHNVIFLNIIVYLLLTEFFVHGYQNNSEICLSNCGQKYQSFFVQWLMGNIVRLREDVMLWTMWYTRRYILARNHGIWYWIPPVGCERQKY